MLQYSFSIPRGFYFKLIFKIPQNYNCSTHSSKLYNNKFFFFFFNKTITFFWLFMNLIVIVVVIVLIVFYTHTHTYTIKVSCFE